MFGSFEIMDIAVAISNSGLRILLSLMKRYKTFRMTEVQPDIYHVLAMTGFTKIMPVEKALRRLSIDGYDMIGQGGVGSVYRLDGDTIIKVFREGTSLDEVRTEITMAKDFRAWHAHRYLLRHRPGRQPIRTGL